VSADAATDDPIAAMERADRRVEDVLDEIESIGREDVDAVAEAYDDAVSLLDGYQGRASGTGREEFQAFVQFQNQFTTLVEGLPEDVPRRESFEQAMETVDKRRLSESDFERARSHLEPAEEVADLLTELDDARERYRDARSTVSARLRAVEGEIDDLERLRELGEADLSAPTERLREPIADYDRTVREAFDRFRKTAPARDVLEFVVTTAKFPLVGFERPPDELLAYVRERPAGEEPIPTLLEYADYSRSKLSHYVEDPAELKRRVSTRRTYLDGLDAEPLTVGGPPPQAGELRYFLREAIQVCGRFADEAVVATARDLRNLPDGTDYERLRNAAVAEDRLDEAERRRLSSGDLDRQLRELREERDRLEEALAEYPRR